ncbi:hypothetical protein J4447_04360 [Candidatus Pacearchaeota archaeon]|nr:hypothetical protein [Candidatus Pacearchaeota archaeon]
MKEDPSKGIYHGGNADFNRKLIERKSTKAIILDHAHNKRDSLYERDSGLNQVLCRMAKQKNVIFIIDLNELNAADLKTRAEILGRIIQNIRLINKFKNHLKIIRPNNLDDNDVLSFLISLGASTDLAKRALAKN